jgi:hypothetical protein
VRKQNQARKRAGFFECSDLTADMRNTNNSIDLWPIQFSDYAADTRKLNAYNALRQTPIVATRAGGVRTRHSQEYTSRGVGRDVVDGRARLGW